MAYNLKIDVVEDILWVTATGKRTLQTVISISRDILAACVEKDRKKVLIDVLGLEGRLDAMDSYDIPAKYFPKIRDRSVITSCAIVDAKELKNADKFFEDVAVNRGFNLQIFSDPQEAAAWLKK